MLALGLNVQIQHNFISVFLDKTIKIGSMISFIAIKNVPKVCKAENRHYVLPYAVVVKTVSIPWRKK